jgi:hypothetical protein
MSCDMTKSVFIILLLLLSIACGGTELDPDSSQDPFKNHLINALPGINVHSAIHPGSDLIYEASWLILPEDHGKLIIYDRADYTLKLLNRDGEILSTGGGQGRGPGEFGDYARFYPGLENRLYAVDAMNHRIHLYEITDTGIDLIKTQLIEYPATYHLSTLHVTEAGYFGVFSQFDNFFNPDNRYLLYRLNEQFEMEEKLLELPGEQRPLYEFPQFTAYLPNTFAERTLWDMDGEWFYYLSTHSSEITRFHLDTGMLEIISLISLPEREQNTETIQFFKEKYGSNDENTDPEQFFSVLFDNQLMPMFLSFRVQDQILLLQTFYPAADEGVILYADLHSEEVFHIKAPHALAHFSLRNNVLYGIDYDGTGGRHDLIMLEKQQFNRK